MGPVGSRKVEFEWPLYMLIVRMCGCVYTAALLALPSVHAPRTYVGVLVGTHTHSFVRASVFVCVCRNSKVPVK